MQNPISIIPITPPPPEQHRKREAFWAKEGEKRNRYHLPTELQSRSPIGYRTRVALTKEEADQISFLFSLEAPQSFVKSDPIFENELFDEASLGIVSSRQSTNFQGHRQYTFGPEKSKEIASILHQLDGREGPVLDHAAYTHIVLNRPYRTPFTLLLTFIGHKPLTSLATVPVRGWKKRYRFEDDIPTIGYLPHLHMGILADGLERAVVLASSGKRQANSFMGPFCSQNRIDTNRSLIQQLEKLIDLSPKEYNQGWRIRMVTQVGQLETPHPISTTLCRKVAANLLAFRSERIMPGVNAEKKAPEGYQKKQNMNVSDEFIFQAGRAAYNAFVRWTGCSRERSKDLLLLDRIDNMQEVGNQKLEKINRENNQITDYIIRDIPKWADIPTGKQLSKNAERGRKAFALTGQRIYIAGLDRAEVERENIDWFQAIQAVGAVSARSALYCELTGCVALPNTCDLLAGICIMAGPVNQNDIGKQFYDVPDLLKDAHPDKDPTSLLVWTLKAKTITDPLGNEEQLLNPKRKGALVDLRPGVDEICFVEQEGSIAPMRSGGSQERAFADLNNFATSVDGEDIPGNRGEKWPGGNPAIWT
ncbi:MAG: hypothetical protein VX278_16365 [Myxococcota bacterium]|nr:hypothetical protein [Myxococcota bacterium]